ncbi:MAG: antitoxin [Actinomycetota bacterium]|nr:antitoxin [Actinomycetota bacterium]
MLTRRLQILLDDERYERLVRRATEGGTSIAVLVRDAIDARYPAIDPERRAAADAILAAESISLPEDPVDLKREILETRSKWA